MQMEYLIKNTSKPAVSGVQQKDVITMDLNYLDDEL